MADGNGNLRKEMRKSGELSLPDLGFGFLSGEIEEIFRQPSRRLSVVRGRRRAFPKNIADCGAERFGCETGLRQYRNRAFFQIIGGVLLLISAGFSFGKRDRDHSFPERGQFSERGSACARDHEVRRREIISDIVCKGEGDVIRRASGRAALSGDVENIILVGQRRIALGQGVVDCFRAEASAHKEQNGLPVRGKKG